jgi:methylated-DNA-[protein]-cysteine S-methyltransferase
MSAAARRPMTSPTDDEALPDRSATAAMPVFCTTHDGPLGPMLLVAGDAAMHGIYFDAQKHLPARLAERCTAAETPLLCQARRELDEYFAGRRRVFTLPCAPQGSAFQRAVWQAIAQVPFGRTITYGELARRAGHAGSPRAAGAATGRNPIGIVIPCHRIVGADGSLTGYAGGLDRKTHLLGLEGAMPARTARAGAAASMSLF